MKKFLVVLLSVVFALCSFTLSACNDDSAENTNGTVSIKYFQQAKDMLPMLLKADSLQFGLLPEPAATQITKMASDKTWYRMDVQELYDGETLSYPQAVMLIKQSLLSEYPTLVNKISSAFTENVEWVKNNPSDAVNAVNSKIEEGQTPSLVAGNITSEVVDNCKIYWQSATSSKKAVNKYLNDIISIESKSAEVVGDEFFYDNNAEGEFSGQTVKVFAPDGAPALAIAKFIYDNENFETGKNFSYQVVSSEKIGLKVASGEGDIVIIPVNAASKLYKSNLSDTYKMAGVVTHGNLYLMSSVPFITLADKTVGVIGQGLVPDLTFRCVLKANKLGIKIA